MAQHPNEWHRYLQQTMLYNPNLTLAEASKKASKTYKKAVQYGGSPHEVYIVYIPTRPAQIVSLVSTPSEADAVIDQALRWDQEHGWSTQNEYRIMKVEMGKNYLYEKKGPPLLLEILPRTTQHTHRSFESTEALE